MPGTLTPPAKSASPAPGSPPTQHEPKIVTNSTRTDTATPVGCCGSKSNTHAAETTAARLGFVTPTEPASAAAATSVGANTVDPVAAPPAAATSKISFSAAPDAADPTSNIAAVTSPNVKRRVGLWQHIVNALDLNGCSKCPLASDGKSGEACCTSVESGCRAGALVAPSPCARRRWWRGRAADLSPAEPTATEVITLNLVRAGAAGSIREINGVGPLRRRLLEMGVLPGTRFKVERVAPLGDPIELRIRGYALSLRRSEAAHILVESAS